MSDKLPQPTDRLIHRLRRVATWLDRYALNEAQSPSDRATMRARANTCLQAAGRLEDLHLGKTAPIYDTSAYAVGDRIEYQMHETWHPGTVISVGRHRITIRLDQYNSYHRSVGTGHLRKETRENQTQTKGLDPGRRFFGEGPYEG